MSSLQFIFVAAVALLLSAACGSFFMAWLYGRRRNRVLEGSIGELQKASVAMAETRSNEAKDQALTNLKAADKEFRDAINSPRDNLGSE